LDSRRDISLFKCKPDALVVLDAGLATYTEWKPAILWTIVIETQFGVTEYAEAVVRGTAYRLSALLGMQAAREGSVYSVPGAPTSGRCGYFYMQGPPNCPVEVNPFQKPGQRTIPWRLPNLQNGFTMRVA
jgi:hypothetical protein